MDSPLYTGEQEQSKQWVSPKRIGAEESPSGSVSHQSYGDHFLGCNGEYHANFFYRLNSRLKK